MRSSFQVSQNPSPSVTAPSPQPVSNAPLISCIAIAAALSLVLVSLGYRKYRTHQRSRLLQRQIAMLEALWRLSSTKRER